LKEVTLQKEFELRQIGGIQVQPVSNKVWQERHTKPHSKLPKSIPNMKEEVKKMVQSPKREDLYRMTEISKENYGLARQHKNSSMELDTIDNQDKI
ncbi:hypothetical protein KPH14_012904, partial [Odynerus spinipes]